MIGNTQVNYNDQRQFHKNQYDERGNFDEGRFENTQFNQGPYNENQFNEGFNENPRIRKNSKDLMNKKMGNIQMKSNEANMDQIYSNSKPNYKDIDYNELINRTINNVPKNPAQMYNKSMPKSSKSNTSNQMDNNQMKNFYPNYYGNVQGPNQNDGQNPANNNHMQTTNQGGKPRTIALKDYITTTTNSNKKIKRIDPNSYINEDYDYLCTNIFLLSKDQIGCRFLQKKLSDEPDIATNLFFKAVMPYSLPLMKDPFGNYLIQKLITNLDETQLLSFIQIISKEILDIGCNPHGTRVVQHMIGFLKTKNLRDCFLRMISPYIINLLKELNGTHIVQKFGNEFPEYSPYIMRIVISNVETLSKHRHGCCVIQKYLEISENEIKKLLIYRLVELCLVLVVDQFGNYVMQNLIQMNFVAVTNNIIDQMLPNILFYSKHKYSSNVVEKCFDHADQIGIQKLLSALNHTPVLNDLILDEHGNYVMQKVLEKCNVEQQNEIFTNVIPVIPKLKTLLFGERIINILCNNYPQMSLLIYGKEGKKKKKGGKKGKGKGKKDKDSKDNQTKNE